MDYFLSHPRSGDVVENLYRAHRIAESIDFVNVVEPFKLVPQDGSIDTFDAMGECLKLLLNCDAIILAGDYKNSRGCLLEEEVARHTGKEIYEYHNGVLKRLRNKELKS